MGIILAVRGIVRAEIRQNLLKAGGIKAPRQGARDQGPHAVAHHAPDTLLAVGGEAVLFQRVVDRVGQVPHGVQKRSVEIE